jgi:hypothetical protein
LLALEFLVEIKSYELKMQFRGTVTSLCDFSVAKAFQAKLGLLHKHTCDKIKNLKALPVLQNCFYKPFVSLVTRNRITFQQIQNEISSRSEVLHKTANEIRTHPNPSNIGINLVLVQMQMDD